MNEEGVVISFSMENLQADTLNENYLKLSFKDCGMTAEAGKPAIPYRFFTTAVSGGAIPEITVTPLRKKYFEGFSAIPSDINIADSSAKFDFSVYPSSSIKIIGKDNILGIPVLRWIYFPVVYSSEKKTFTVTTEAEIIIKTPSPKIALRGNLTKQHKKLLAKTIHNFDISAIEEAVKTISSAQEVTYDLNDGTWLRMTVDKEGLYKITYNTAVNAGLDPDGVELSRVKIYGNHGMLLSYATPSEDYYGLRENGIKTVDLNGNGIWDEEDYIIFYGRGANNYLYNSETNKYYYAENPYDIHNYYFLTVSAGAGKRITSASLHDIAYDEEVVNTAAMFHYEKSRQNFLESGTEWYDTRFSGTAQSREYPFTLPSVPSPSTAAVLEVAFKGGSGSFYNEPGGVYNFSVSVNGTGLLSSVYLSGSTYKTATAVFDASLLNISNTFYINYSSYLSYSYAFFDYLDIQYTTDNIIRDSGFPMFAPLTQAAYKFKIANPANLNDILIWNVTDPYLPREMTVTVGDTVSFIDTTAHGRYYVSARSLLLTPDNIEPVSNHPNLCSPAYNADLLIITSRELADAADKLSALKENNYAYQDAMDVLTVFTEDIYTEFSSGRLSPAAIRNFIKFAVENWNKAPSFVLFLGDGHFDYKNILHRNPNFVPPFEYDAGTQLNSRTVEYFFTDTDFNGNFYHIFPDIPLGRINVENQNEFDAYYDKLIHYVESYLYADYHGGWQINATMVADDEQSTLSSSEITHILDTESILSSGVIPSYMNINKIYLTDYEPLPGGLGTYKPGANDALIEQYNRGTAIINYFGHGSSDSWAKESVFNLSRDLPRLRNNYLNPFILAATCTFGLFDQPAHTAASEELLKAEETGIIGIIAAARPTFSGPNKTMVQNFLGSLFTFTPGTNLSATVGEAFFNAFNLSAGDDNSQKYLLMGDPTLRIAAGGLRMEITELQSDTLKALSHNRFKAVVTNSDGSVNTFFNGSAVLNVFDAVSDYITPLEEFPVLTYQHPGKAIFRGQYTVIDGVAEGEFIIPKSIAYKNEPTARLSFYAWSEDAKMSAVGSKDSLTVYGSEQGVDDRTGPKIDISFVENPAFTDGDIINSNATIKLSLEDENGINITNEPGHELMVIVDDKQMFNVTDYFLYEENSYREGSLEYPLSALTPGLHSLTVKAWDNLNNLTIDETKFEVMEAGVESDKLSLEHVVNVPNPFSESTQFTFTVLNNQDDYFDAVIKIYTITGRMIKKIERTVTDNPNGLQKIYWDGRDDDGDYLANGVYIYKITVKNDSKKATVTEKLMLLK